LPSPVRISAILPSFSAMPPISCTSKWRIFSAALAAFAHDGEGFGQEIVQGLALGVALAEFGRLGLELGVAQCLEIRLECVDLLHDAPVLLQQAFVAATEDLGE
jgi:hypothetical protein